MTQVFLGFAPIGALNTGWCVWRTDKTAGTQTVLKGESTNVDKALTAACEHFAETPDAVGIAAPLHWTTRDDREADRILRGMVLSLGGKSATVPALPSVSGAKITGGVMLAAQILQRWGTMPVTEAAPDVLLMMDSAVSELDDALDVNSDAEKHAALAAYTAIASREQRQNWHDLRQFDKDSYEPVIGIKAAFWLPVTAC